MKLDLSGHVALVTGAGGQLGRAISRVLAECGADVALHYRTSKDVAETLRGEIESLGRRAVTVQADITDADNVRRMHDEVTASLGDADIVVANAVIQYSWKGVLEQDVADYEGQFRSCVLQTVLLAKAFAPAMMAKGWGRFVCINTECAMQCFPSQSAYASAKRGLDGVVRTLAKEIGPKGVTVNQVAPGWMISDQSRKDRSESQPAYESRVPLGHRGQDIDIAHAAAFLASDLARFITGVYLPVCGGNVMPGI